MTSVAACTSDTLNCSTPHGLQLWMLIDSRSNKTFPAFNCNPFSTTADKLPGWTAAAPRNLHTSGCKLFALSSYLRGGDCVPPTYDATNGWKAGSMSAVTVISGVTTTYPRLFLQFLCDYILSLNPSLKTRDSASQDLSTKILLPDPQGAISFAQPLIDAVNKMLQYQTPVSALQFNIDPVKTVNVAEGTEIEDISNAVLAGNPVLTGVGNTESAHCVLVVGMVKNAGKTYYITSDSGFVPMDPNQRNQNGTQPAITPVRAVYKWEDVQPFTISTCGVSDHFHRIFWYQTVSGVGQMTCVASSSINK